MIVFLFFTVVLFGAVALLFLTVDAIAPYTPLAQSWYNVHEYVATTLTLSAVTIIAVTALYIVYLFFEVVLN